MDLSRLREVTGRLVLDEMCRVRPSILERTGLGVAVLDLQRSYFDYIGTRICEKTVPRSEVQLTMRRIMGSLVSAATEQAKEANPLLYVYAPWHLPEKRYAWAVNTGEVVTVCIGEEDDGTVALDAAIALAHNVGNWGIHNGSGLQKNLILRRFHVVAQQAKRVMTLLPQSGIAVRWELSSAPFFSPGRCARAQLRAPRWAGAS